MNYRTAKTVSMSKEEFLRLCKIKFTKVKNPQVPEELDVAYKVLFSAFWDDWMARRFSTEANRYAEELYDFYTSPLIKAIS